MALAELLSMTMYREPRTHTAAPPTTSPTPRDQLDKNILILARAGYSIGWIARDLGHSKSHIQYRLERMGTSIAVLRAVRCTFCNVLLQRGRYRPLNGIHCCLADACRVQQHRLANRAYQKHGRRLTSTTTL